VLSYFIPLQTVLKLKWCVAICISRDLIYKGFVMWHFLNYCLVQIVSLWHNLGPIPLPMFSGTKQKSGPAQGLASYFLNGLIIDHQTDSWPSILRSCFCHCQCFLFIYIASMIGLLCLCLYQWHQTHLWCPMHFVSPFKDICLRLISTSHLLQCFEFLCWQEPPHARQGMPTCTKDGRVCVACFIKPVPVLGSNSVFFFVWSNQY